MGSIALQKVWDFLDDPESSVAALIWAIFIKSMILCSVVTSLVQTVPNDFPAHQLAAAVLEMAFDSIFTIELLVRLYVCPNRWIFLQSPYTWIDCFASSALILRAAVGLAIPRPGDEDVVSITL